MESARCRLAARSPAVKTKTEVKMPSPVDVSEPKQLLARSGPCAFGGGDELLSGGLLGEDLLGPVERRVGGREADGGQR